MLYITQSNAVAITSRQLLLPDGTTELDIDVLRPHLLTSEQHTELCIILPDVRLAQINLWDLMPQLARIARQCKVDIRINYAAWDEDRQGPRIEDIELDGTNPDRMRVITFITHEYVDSISRLIAAAGKPLGFGRPGMSYLLHSKLEVGNLRDDELDMSFSELRAILDKRTTTDWPESQSVIVLVDDEGTKRYDLPAKPSAAAISS